MSGSPGTHRARKRFGQNFLVSQGIIARIVEAIDPRAGQAMVEIGPGQGALTAPLFDRLDRLHAVEIDRDLAASLASRFPPDRLVLHVGDALAFDYDRLPSPLRIVGNLPYNISTPLLFVFETHAARLQDLHLMLQREVVERMAASHSTPEYGRLSVMVQRRFDVEPLFDVPPGAFHPRPEVHSTFVRLVPRGQASDERTRDAAFRRLATVAFSGRRKTLRNALRGLLDEDDFRAAGVDSALRAENLSVPAYEALTARLVLRGQTAGEIDGIG